MSNITKSYSQKKVLISRLKTGDDLINAITKIAVDQKIEIAIFSGIGALSKAVFSYYNQDTKEYQNIPCNDHCEIISLMGNISLKDNSPICHGHIGLGDDKGKAFGGHLVEGCKIFACELTITILEGEPLHRGFDDITGLPLWDR